MPVLPLSREAIAKIETGQKTATSRRITSTFKVGDVCPICPAPATLNPRARFDPHVGYVLIEGIGTFTPAEICVRFYKQEGFDSPQALMSRFIELKINSQPFLKTLFFRYLGKVKG